ncbi:MAG: hypothetical protein JXK93_00730 [Sphaerochaetaceae bacterium]|nr:hypothetical protein [Sphaerochaetaceae bacterium]
MKAQRNQRVHRHIGHRRILLLSVNALSLAAVLIVNILSQSLPLNGFRIEEISDFYVNLLVPSPGTFAIWGVIYVLLIFNQIYQVAVSISQDRGDILERIGFSLLPVHLLNILWLFSWHYLYRFITTSGLVMILLLMALVSLYRKAQRESDFLSERILVLLPVSIYLGWIMVATAVNLTSIFSSFAPSLYATFATGITIGTMIGVAFIYAVVSSVYKDLWISVVGLWALWGIFDRYREDVQNTVLARTALIILTLLAMNVLITLIRKTRTISDEDELF